MINFIKNKKYFSIVLFLVFYTAFFFAIIIFSNFISVTNQQFPELANSFLHHQLYFLDSSPYNKFLNDNTYFNQHYYWPLGPLPAVILIPFVWLGNILGFYFFQGYLNSLLTLFLFYLILKISRKINYSYIDSAYWAIAFVFGSMFLGVVVINNSCYFAHTVATSLMFLAILEYFGRKRFWLIGFLFGLILLTRLTAFIGILFFVFDILFLEKNNWKIKFKNIFKLSIVPIICFCLLFIYNYARFNNIFDQGYKNQILPPAFMDDKNNYGLFNLKYLPRGIYYSLINMPSPVYSSETHLLTIPFIKPDVWGLSIFITSPYLLYLFFMKIKNKKATMLLIVSAITCLAILSSFFIGYAQFGFRYALDFMPLLFLAFILIYKDQKDKIGSTLKTIIILSTLFNLYLLFQLL